MPSVERVAVISHGRDVAEPVALVHGIAARLGVEALEGDDVDLAVVLGGDGTMLRALHRFLGQADHIEAGLERAFRGEYQTFELATLEVDVNGATHSAVNDVVVAGGTLGRMVELGYSVGGEDLGHQPCDGLICATPTGSTAYNLSNGGPVLVWGLDAMALTFVAPHALVIRPLVVPRGADVTITNLTPNRETYVLVDGMKVGALATGEHALVRVSDRPTLLATLPEVTFFTRYAATFGR